MGRQFEVSGVKDRLSTVSKPERHRRLRQDILFVTQTTISISKRDHASSVPGIPDILTILTRRHAEEIQGVIQERDIL